MEADRILDLQAHVPLHCSRLPHHWLACCGCVDMLSQRLSHVQCWSRRSTGMCSRTALRALHDRLLTYHPSSLPGLDVATVCSPVSPRCCKSCWPRTSIPSAATCCKPSASLSAMISSSTSRMPASTSLPSQPPCPQSLMLQVPAPGFHSGHVRVLVGSCCCARVPPNIVPNKITPGDTSQWHAETLHSLRGPMHSWVCSQACC